MKYDDLKAMMAQEGKNRPHRYRHIEGDIQEACVTWFKYAYPNYIVFSVPNGGTRNGREALQLKKEGALAGVADLVIIAERAVLFVEMKHGKNKQQKSQKEFQKNVERLGHTYAVCYSLQDFQMTIERWLKEIYSIQKSLKAT